MKHLLIRKNRRMLIKNLLISIGTGLAGLTAAFYLVRDGQMKGEHIHLLEKLELAGGQLRWP